jgi:general L-amino acid transport system permease protein
MRLVMLPQALRVIIPPMTNQFLNLTKNSSLAVAIGYPDVVSIANTASTRPGVQWSASPSSCWST